MLFQWGQFKSAAGLDLDWKIECDALDPDDWDCIANVAAPMLHPFSAVCGVPYGGLPLASALNRYITTEGPLLIVDDVWTTGKSMTEFAGDIPAWKGFVAFARGELPSHVMCFAKLSV